VKTDASKWMSGPERWSGRAPGCKKNGVKKFRRRVQSRAVFEETYNSKAIDAEEQGAREMSGGRDTGQLLLRKASPGQDQK